MPKAEPLESRFWKYVDKTESCWLWTGMRAGRGYGSIKAHRSRINLYAHRVSWSIHFGAIPDGLFVLHACDNPLCVNPNHLFLGTASDNMKDCYSKNRHNGCVRRNWHGENSPNSRLTWEAAKDIKSSDESLLVLARRYGVQKAAIWKVRQGLTWREP